MPLLLPRCRYLLPAAPASVASAEAPCPAASTLPPLHPALNVPVPVASANALRSMRPPASAPQPLQLSMLMLPPLALVLPLLPLALTLALPALSLLPL